ncbi:MAG: hypothetical protein GY780_18365 [bacterium]|nr:hypothetical protein [bacterium]
MKIAIIGLFSLVLALPVSGATLRVERDGSGDFLTIQDAVDAAASGDIILIGPGRYNEGEIVTTPGWTAFVRVLVAQSELTLIGAGPEETILGPTEPYDYSLGNLWGIVANPDFGCTSKIRIENIGFENMRYAINALPSPDQVEIENCRFDSNASSFSCYYGDNFELTNSIFNNSAEGSISFGVKGFDQVRISDCNFLFEGEHQYPDMGVHLESNRDVEVSNCNFEGGAGGLTVASGYEGIFAQITGCTFENHFNTNRSGVGFRAQNSNCNIEDCFFLHQDRAIRIYGPGSNVRVINSVIQDVTRSSVDIAHLESLQVTNCILAHGDYTVRQNYYCPESSARDLPILNMTYNDWGTTDADTIASWIHLCDYDVDFIPFIGQPVATEHLSFGGVKAMYRGTSK